MKRNESINYQTPKQAKNEIKDLNENYWMCGFKSWITKKLAKSEEIRTKILLEYPLKQILS